MPRIGTDDPVTNLTALEQFLRPLLSHFIGRILPLADDAFQIHLHDFIEEQPSVSFDVIEVQDSRAFPTQKPFQHGVPLNEPHSPKILPVEVKKVERKKHALPFSK
jgi:hypothetical protein